MWNVCAVLGKCNTYAWWAVKYQFQWFYMSSMFLNLRLRLIFHNIKVNCKIHANNLNSKYQIKRKNNKQQQQQKHHKSREISQRKEKTKVYTFKRKVFLLFKPGDLPFSCCTGSDKICYRLCSNNFWDLNLNRPLLRSCFSKRTCKWLESTQIVAKFMWKGLENDAANCHFDIELFWAEDNRGKSRHRMSSLPSPYLSERRTKSPLVKMPHPHFLYLYRDNDLISRYEMALRKNLHK